ncbi:hypothetical protein, partial [Bacillus cereus]
CNVTGTMVSFCCGIGKAPPFIDTCIVPGGAACLYALFEWGLTVHQWYEIGYKKKRRMRV